MVVIVRVRGWIIHRVNERPHKDGNAYSIWKYLPKAREAGLGFINNPDGNLPRVTINASDLLEFVLMPIFNLPALI